MKLSVSPRPSDRKSTRLNSSHVKISYAVFCLKKKKIDKDDASEESLRCERLRVETSRRAIERRQAPLDFFFKSYGNHRDLHSFPTRRSSDPTAAQLTRLPVKRLVRDLASMHIQRHYD